MKRIFLSWSRCWIPLPTALLVAFVWTNNGRAQNFVSNPDFEEPLGPNNWTIMYVYGGPNDFFIKDRTRLGHRDESPGTWDADPPGSTNYLNRFGLHFKAGHDWKMHAYATQVITNLTPGVRYTVRAYMTIYENPNKLPRVYLEAIGETTVRTPDVVTIYRADPASYQSYAVTVMPGESGQIEIRLHYNKDLNTVTEKWRNMDALYDRVSLILTPTNYPPVVITPPQSQTVNHGNDATFSVVVDAPEPVAYQWQFSGANLTGATASTYTRTNAQPADAGAYAVIVSNPYGAVLSPPATLTVNFAPVIVWQPEDRTVLAGQDATFKVTAAAVPAPAYQWQFNSVNIDGATASSYTRSNALPVLHTGNYSVIVSNFLGSVTSSNAVLAIATVPEQPAITTQPQNQTVRPGTNVTFTIKATGAPSPTYQWRFNGVPIEDATDSHYTRYNVSTNDAGDYSVLVNNVLASVASSNATLTVTLPIPFRLESIENLFDGRMRLVISGEPGESVWVEASTNLLNWQSLGNVVNTNGTFEFIDDLATNSSEGFYRTRR